MVEEARLSFLNAPSLARDNDVALNRFSVLGVPTEKGHIFRPGTVHGPESVRKASLMYYYPDFDGLYDPEMDRYILEGSMIGDVGDVPDNPLATFDQRVEDTIRFIRERGSIPITIGGDHSITYPILKAFDTPIDVIHLDAHSDFQRYDEGGTAECGLVMRRSSELPVVRRIVHAGQRGYLNSGQGIRDSRQMGNTVIPCDSLKQQGSQAITRLIGDLPVYVSFDVDVLDPSICPGTTVPEPGGIDYALAKDILTSIVRNAEIVGADFVELSPPHDPSELGSFYVTKLILDFMGEIGVNSSAPSQ